MMEKILFLLIFLSFSLGHLGRISFFNQQVNFYIYEVFLVFYFFINLWQTNLSQIKKIAKKNKIILIFISYTLITFFFNLKSFRPFENFAAFLYLLRLSFYFFLFTFFNKSFKKQQIKIYLNLFFFLTIISSLVQYFLYPNLRNLLYLGWDPHQYRLFGLFFDTYLAASIYGLGFLYFLFLKRKGFWQKFSLIFYFIFILMTFSRVTYLALFLTLFIYFLHSKKIKRFFLLILIGVLIVIFLPKPQGAGVDLTRIFSIKSRFLDYQVGVNLWLKKPILGWGYNRLRYIKNDLVSHAGAGLSSSFLIILVDTGIIGFLLFLYCLKRLIKKKSYVLFYLLFLIVVSLADNVLLHPFILFLFFVLANQKEATENLNL